LHGELKMRNLAIHIAVIALGCATAGADWLKVGKLPYAGVRIADVEDGMIAFFAVGPRAVLKPLAEVRAIAIDGRNAFNQAEKLLSAGKAAQAVEYYDKALLGASGWYEKLIRYRRLVALDQARQVSKATEEWLVLLAESGGAPETVRLRPRRFPPPGDRLNAEAIALLEARARRVKDDKIAAAAINELLLALYGHEGRQEKASVLAERIVSTRQSASAPATGPSGQKAAVTEQAARLEAMAVLIGQGKPDQVLDEITTNLEADRYETALLPQALLLAGKAAQQLAARAEGARRRQLLVAAGLDFMRVATFFPRSRQAPEALLAAGNVNAALGNAWAAGNAYKAVIQRYPDSEAAGQARASGAPAEQTGRSATGR